MSNESISLLSLYLHLLLPDAARKLNYETLFCGHDRYRTRSEG